MNSRESKSASRKPASLNVHLGTLEEMGARFIDAWNRAERGESVDESHVTFLDIETLVGTLSTRRIELLRNVRQHGGYPSIRAIADSLERDYKNVHTDIAQLIEWLAVERTDDGRVFVPWTEILVDMKLPTGLAA